MSENLNRNGRPTYKRGRLREVMAYFWATPGRAIGIDELEKKLKQYNRHQLMQTMNHIVTRGQKYGYPIERLGQGVWKLVEPKGHEETPEVQTSFIPKVETPQVQIVQADPNMMMVEVLKERDTHLIVEDVDDGKIYKMTLVG